MREKKKGSFSYCGGLYSWSKNVNTFGFVAYILFCFISFITFYNFAKFRCLFSFCSFLFSFSHFGFHLLFCFHFVHVLICFSLVGLNVFPMV